MGAIIFVLDLIGEWFDLFYQLRVERALLEANSQRATYHKETMSEMKKKRSVTARRRTRTVARDEKGRFVSQEIEEY